MTQPAYLTLIPSEDRNYRQAVTGKIHKGAGPNTQALHCNYSGQIRHPYTTAIRDRMDVPVGGLCRKCFKREVAQLHSDPSWDDCRLAATRALDVAQRMERWGSFHQEVQVAIMHMRAGDVASVQYLERMTNHGDTGNRSLTAARANARMAARRLRKAGDTRPDDEVTWYLNEYLADREYGGPEEGGWWYDTGTFVKCHGSFVLNVAAQDRLEQLDGYLDAKREGLADPGSVTCTGYPIILVESEPGADYPAEHPVYS